MTQLSLSLLNLNSPTLKDLFYSMSLEGLLMFMNSVNTGVDTIGGSIDKNKKENDHFLYYICRFKGE